MIVEWNMSIMVDVMKGDCEEEVEKKEEKNENKMK